MRDLADRIIIFFSFGVGIQTVRLLYECMKQDKNYIEQLFREHYLRMYRLAMSLLKDSDASKDVVSDIFADMLGKGQVPEVGNIDNYLLVATRNRCLNLINRSSLTEMVHRLWALELKLSLNTRETEDRYQQVMQYIDEQLPPQAQRVMKMRYQDHCSYKEIADALQISEKTVYKHLHESILKIKQHFNP